MIRRLIPLLWLRLFSFLVLRHFQSVSGFAFQSPSFSVPTPSFVSPSFARRRSSNDFQEGSHRTGDYGEADVPVTTKSAARPYWDDEVENEWTDEQSPYTVATALEKDVLEWEKCATTAGTAWILLPPPTVEKPTAILHFVGGTFMGSAPNIWYRTLLQDIVRHTSCAVVATSIPITVTRSPLDHVRLSTQLQRQFQTAFQYVLTDEYGATTLQSVPLCGLGHSLGARLMVVLATLGGKPRNRIPPYKSFILISFTNFGAAAGIPGIAQLYRRSRMFEQQQQEEEGEERSSNRRRQDDWWDEDDDADWRDLWHEVTATVKAGTARVQYALTPSSTSLEFYPSPEQLWKAVKDDGRYTVPQTLVVQFDDDEVDQSSLLATAIVNSSDVKFARVRGTHLTPVSASDVNSSSNAWLQQVNSRAGRLLTKALQGRWHLRHNAEALLELRQSIARYITEVVTKE